MAVASPVKIKGVALTSVSVAARQVPKAPCAKDWKAAKGLTPTARNSSAHRTSAPASAVPTANARPQAVVSLRGSIR